MRNCNNCAHGSYGLNCNTGVEKLYCTDSIPEFETEPDNICENHQFIEGYENEKNYLLYDDSYFGIGYFIIHTVNGGIDRFLKIYIMNNDGYPMYGLRAFSVDGKDNPDVEFNNIEFIFRSMEDYENGLFEAFQMFRKNADSVIYTIDESQQGRNNVSTAMDGGDILKLIISKDIYRGKQHPSDFIDINLGDNYSCKNYEVINELYNTLEKKCHQSAKEEDIKSLLMLKINSSEK